MKAVVWDGTRQSGAHPQSVQRLWQRRMILARRWLGLRTGIALLLLNYPVGAPLRSAMQPEITDAGHALPSSLEVVCGAVVIRLPKISAPKRIADIAHGLARRA